MIYHSKIHITLKRNLQIMPDAEWLKLLIPHFPDKRGEHLVRYDRWYSSRSRGERWQLEENAEVEEKQVVHVDLNNPSDPKFARAPPPVSLGEVDPQYLRGGSAHLSPLWG